MATIDHSNTIVLLIGASSFPQDPTINPIPNVITNIQKLKECLINEELIGIPEANITVSVDESKSQIERKLRGIFDKTKNNRFTLLVYYTGHGILSSEDFQLYLATHDTNQKDLEVDAVNIEDFKRWIKRSVAGRKIVILDCCHSGAIIGMMGSMASSIQAELNRFEGTYVMTSAAEDTPSLFPEDNPEQPTFFTGKLLDVINEGLDVDKEYCSLRDIYDQINFDFRQIGLPPPQQSNFNNVDQLNLSVNKKFFLRKAAVEATWEDALIKNDKGAFIDFINQFPKSPHIKEAKKKIIEIEEFEIWNISSGRNSFSSLFDYLDKYPQGKYVNEANKQIKDLREKEDEKRREIAAREEKAWKEAIEKNSLLSFQEYLKFYPKGKFAGESIKRIETIKDEEEEEKQELERGREFEEEIFWKDAAKINSIGSFNKYLEFYPVGKFSKEAKNQVKVLQEIENDKLRKEQEERNEVMAWNHTLKTHQASSYEEYLLIYPNGKFSTEAKKRSQILKQEEEQKLERERQLEDENFWEASIIKNSIDSFEEYLERFPKGKFSNEAKKRVIVLHDIEIEKARKEKEEKEREQLRRENEKKQRLERERAREEEALWTKTRERNSREAFTEYLDGYPNGTYSTVAKKEIAVLDRIEREKIRKEEEERRKEKLRLDEETKEKKKEEPRLKLKGKELQHDDKKNFFNYWIIGSIAAILLLAILVFVLKQKLSSDKTEIHQKETVSTHLGRKGSQRR